MEKIKKFLFENTSIRQTIAKNTFWLAASTTLSKIIRSDETRARLDTMGTFAAGTSPEEFDTFIAAETAKWSKVIKDAGVKPD